MAAPLLMDFLCPITLTPMQDPVVTADGTEAPLTQPSALADVQCFDRHAPPVHHHACTPCTYAAACDQDRGEGGGLGIPTLRALSFEHAIWWPHKGHFDHASVRSQV
jgi:hypothetical protein